MQFKVRALRSFILKHIIKETKQRIQSLSSEASKEPFLIKMFGEHHHKTSQEHIFLSTSLVKSGQ